MAKAKQVDFRKATAAPIVLAFGPEDYLIGRTISAIKEQLKTADSSLEVIDLEAGDYAAGQLSALTSPSLFAEPKLLIIKNLERLTDELIADGLDYLNNPTADCTVILTHSGSSVRGKKLLDALRLSPQVIEVLCSKQKKPQERSDFVAAEFAEAGRQITPAAIRALVDAFGENLAQLASACSQLIQDSASSVTEELVDTYYGGRIETTTWKISDAAFASQPVEALSLLRHALSSGLDPVPIVSGLSMSMRQLAKLSANRSATAAALGMEPWKLEKLRRNLNGWTEENMAKVINAIADADAAAKGASRDPQFVLERLVILIAKKGQL
jgi:DNA polymerase-3 subunit delta